jgi:hypothetical protein
MAEQDDEREVSRLYRQLPREEPSAELDAAIRAEARSAVEVHPAPLVPPTGRRQWYFPVAAAAVIVLAVAVTWHVEQEQPDPVVAPVPAAPPAQAPKKEEVPGPRRELTRERMARNDSASEAKPATPPAAASGILSAPQAETRAKALAKVESPEAELERIAELRRQGQHEEADKALAEFRKRHPDFRIPEEMLRKVERR